MSPSSRPALAEATAESNASDNLDGASVGRPSVATRLLQIREVITRLVADDLMTTSHPTMAVAIENGQAAGGSPDDTAPPERMSESILIRDGFFCGRRFRGSTHRAVWFTEEDELKVHRADGTWVATLGGDAIDQFNQHHSHDVANDQADRDQATRDQAESDEAIVPIYQLPAAQPVRRAA